MKKTFALLLVLTMLTACSAALAEDYTMVIAAQNTEDAAVGRGYTRFKELIEDQSGGQIKCDIHYGGTLGGQTDALQALQMGTVQMAEITTSTATAVENRFCVFDLPYLVKDIDSLLTIVYDKGAGDLLKEYLEQSTGGKLTIAGWMCISSRNVYSSRGPINSIDDFKGLTIRTMESTTMIDAFTRLGASPQAIASNERYLALQTKVVDAAENLLSYLITCKDYEVTKYVSLTNHLFTPNLMVVDKTWVDRLPEELQAMVYDCAKEAGLYTTQIEKEDAASAVEQLEALGMTINEVADIDSIRAALVPMYDDYKDEIGGELYGKFVG